MNVTLPIPYTLTEDALDRHELAEAQRRAAAGVPIPYVPTEDAVEDTVDYASLDLAALRAATKDALDDLVRLSETAAWGDIDDVEVDAASALFVELQSAYNAALIASSKRHGDA